jgi:curved DNA-binding protein CbpA
MNYDFSSHQHHNRDKFDPYDVLDLPRDADKNAIKQRFRKLTRVHHPDRNKNNPDYDPDHYARICSAYEILSDPRKRAAYNQQHAPSWNNLRESSRDFSAAVPQNLHFSHQGKFGDSDLKRFNEAFERSRAADPNDRGYGDRMASRHSGTTLEELQRMRSMDQVSPENKFNGATKVSEGAFNARFEAEMKARRQTAGAGLMERPDDPLAWNGGTLATGGGYSEVSYYEDESGEGWMVDRGVDDFTRLGGVGGDGSGLGYSDYMSGFNTFTDQLPEDHAYYNATGDAAALKKAYNQRMSELSQIPDRGHSRSFAESEALMKKKQEEEWRMQQDRNKAHVLKYRDQYASEDLLPPPRVAPGGVQVDRQRSEPVLERPRPGGSRHHSTPGGRDPSVAGVMPAQPITDFRPASSNNSQVDANMINNRMMQRMMDPVRRSQPNW